MSKKWSLSIQGIDSQLKNANGSYDVLDYNDLDADKATYILKQLKEITDELDYSVGDKCPPSFSINYNEGEVFTFYIDNKKIHETEFNKEFSEKEVLSIATGEQKLDEAKLSKEKKEAEGIYPIRKRNIPPTKKDLKEEDIDTSDKNLQFEEVVWKSRGWMEASNTAPIAIASFFLFVGVIVLGEERDAYMAPYMFLIAAISFLLIFPWRMLAKTKAVYGIDWTSNTLWIKRKKKVLGFAPDANYINELQIKKNETKEANGMWIMEPSMPMYFNKREWHLQFKRQSNEYYWTFNGSAHATKKEAKRVCEKLWNMLNSQM